MTELADVLVVTVRKSFWASPEAERWPRRLYLHRLHGPSTSLLNSLLVFARALAAIWLRPPRVVLLGSVERTVPWFIRARRLGLLRGAKLVVTNQLHLSPQQLAQVDRVIVYARSQAEALGEKGVFLPLPADGDLEAAKAAAEPGDYVFSGGGAGRDFSTLVEAVRGTGIRVRLRVFATETIAEAPGNLRVGGEVSQEQFLVEMAGAACVVVPLLSPDSPHGQTTLVQALALGKPVIATRATATLDYVEDGVDGYLVDAEDAVALRERIADVVRDDELKRRLSERSPGRRAELAYPSHAEKLAAVCRDV